MRTLEDLVKGLPGLEISGDRERLVTSLHYDSRYVKPNSLFVAIRGLKSDGHDFIPEAISNKAGVIVCHRDAVKEEWLKAKNLTWIFSDDTRESLALLASRFHDDAAHKLRLIGVTGTNGKTTTTYLLESIFNRAGFKTGVIGTINCRIKGEIRPSNMTTPESLELHGVFREMVEAGVEYCFIEVSSHSLELKRVWGLNFEGVIFTNLTPEHLDFHRDMESYFRAKAILFTEYSVGFSVINLDDPSGERLLRMIKEGKNITYGFTPEARINPRGVEVSRRGAKFTLNTEGGEIALDTALIGRHNIANIMAAAGAALTQGVSIEAIREGIAAMKAVPGRFEGVDLGQDFSVIVDYAHTGDALQNILSAAKNLNPRKLIVVFGCGGDRDRKKRPLMGEVAVREADYAVITTDNPRSERPEDIVSEIETGIKKFGAGTDRYTIILDRRAAITHALQMARTGDMVIIAGKGHEDYQIIEGRKIHFDDRETAKEILLALGKEKN